MTSISLKGLSRIYDELAVVDRLNLEIGAGEFISLLGASGCGKTTTLRMLAGFIEPSEGTIAVDGVVVSSPARTVPPEARGMSMIFQSYAIWPHMTVQSNVEFGLRLRKTAAAEMKRRVAEVLDLVRLGHLAKRYPAELSGGQQQRVALARAIVVRPKVLLLDEPLSNLDAALRDDMCREIRRLHDELSLTTVYVTHDQAEAMRSSDRIAVMNAGRIEQLSSPQELYAKPDTEFVARFIGKTNILPISAFGDGFHVDGFAGPVLRADGTIPRGAKLLLRPHDIALGTEAIGEPADAVKVVVQERSYLGANWHYVVVPEGGGPQLSVITSAREQFDVGTALWAKLNLGGGEIVRA